MSIELTTKTIEAEKIYFDGCCEQAVDSDISLPDYCPDIMRILKCIIQTNITNSKLSGDRASADGNAEITVIYSDEKNNVCTWKTDYPFSKYAELPSAYDSAVTVCTAKTDYVNCRAVSKRKVDIHGVISLRFKVCGLENETVISSASGDGIQLRKKGIDISSAVACAGKSFQLSSVEKVDDAMPGIGKVLSCFAAPVINETKIIKGKLLIKGELAVRAAYCSDSDGRESAVLGCSLPFNEILEAADFSDTCKTDIQLNVTRLSAEPKVDNDGEYRYMNVNAEVSAYAAAYESSCVNTVIDAYSTQTEIETKYSLIDFKKIAANISDTFNVKQNIDVASLNPQKIFTSVLSAPEIKCSFADRKMTVKGKIPLSLIIIDADGIPVSCEREAEFEYSHPTECEAENLICTPSIAVSGFSCTLNGNGSTEFKAEINISAVIFSSMQERVLTSLAVTDSCAEKDKKPSLTVCFCSGEESLWDIAKHYNTTVEEIMEENELSTDCPQSKTMLMIPIK